MADRVRHAARHGDEALGPGWHRAAVDADALDNHARCLAVGLGRCAAEEPPALSARRHLPACRRCEDLVDQLRAALGVELKRLEGRVDGHALDHAGNAAHLRGGNPCESVLCTYKPSQITPIRLRQRPLRLRLSLLAAVAPECPACGENSPSLCPTISSVTNTRDERLPVVHVEGVRHELGDDGRSAGLGLDRLPVAGVLLRMTSRGVSGR